ncbi:MAG: PRC-barrel domain-containing protein [Methanomassiliicoccales archaeon]
MEDIIGLEIVTSDARIVGTVEGVALDIENWYIPALRISVKKGLEDAVGVKKPLFSSAKILLKTDKVESVSDTITLSVPINGIKDALLDEEMTVTTAADIVGKRVICRKARQIGFANNIIFSPERKWSIPFVEVKLDKEAIDYLKVKKSLLSTPLIKIQTSDIKTIGDMIILKIDAEELKDYLEMKPRKAEAAASKDTSAEGLSKSREDSGAGLKQGESPDYKPRL